MQQFLGQWQGTGIAQFPSIQTTHYRDLLIFEAHGDDPILKVEQKTWRIHDDLSESLLHWESGFLRQLSDNECEWINAQNNGRTEVLRGTIKVNTPSTFQIKLRGVVFSNDPRMLNSERNLTVDNKTLNYTMNMATTAYPTSQIHLEATLTHL